MSETRVKLMERFLEEGKRLVDEDPVQASEKLYKAAEKAVKQLARSLGVEDVLKLVEERGRWTVTDLEKVVRRLRSLEPGVVGWWDNANYLHVWGFHEAKLDSESVKIRLPSVEKIVKLALLHTTT